jgi:tetratricopeptide (TPR) repeat protein
MRRHLLLILITLPALAFGIPLPDQIAELLQHRQWKEACVLLEKTTAAEPDNAEAWHALGQSRLALQDAEGSVAALERAVALQPADARYQLTLGNAYGMAATKAGLLSKMGLARKCKAAYERAVELDPENIDARWSVMEYCRQAPAIVGGGMDKAYAQAAEIKRLDARRGRAAYASLYASEKKYAEAFALYDEVLRAHPGEPDALYNLGRLAALSGEQLDRGLAALREVQPQRGNDARVPACIGDILLKMGDKAGARAAYEAALAINPQHIRALEALRKLKEGEPAG